MKTGGNDYILGVDIGTGSTKAVAVNMQGEVISTVNTFYSTQHSQPGYSEQNITDIWSAFVSCFHESIERLYRVPMAVSISSAMHSLVLMDSDNKPLTPLITWADTRSDKISARLRNSVNAESLYKATGTPIHSMSPLCKIIWFRENDPGLFQRAAHFISIKEYIWHRLFGCYEIDISIASATGLFGICKKQWYQPALDLCGIAPEKLSAIRSTYHLRSNIMPGTADELHLPATTSFCIGASDGCLANLACDAVHSNMAALTIGTSGAVRIACTEPLQDFKSMTFNYLLDDKTFISGGPINSGGYILQWIFKTFFGNDSPSAQDYINYFSEVESVAPGSEGLVFLPYIQGERAPVWDEKACGVFYGIRSEHTRAHFLRAGIEGICFALKSVLEILELLSGKIPRLSVSGGFVRSNVWLQMLSDITGKELLLVQTKDASSIGAVYLAMRAMNIHIVRDNANDKIISPRNEWHQQYAPSYQVFKALYPALTGLMHPPGK